MCATYITYLKGSSERNNRIANHRRLGDPKNSSRRRSGSALLGRCSCHLLVSLFLYAQRKSRLAPDSSDRHNYDRNRSMAFIRERRLFSRRLWRRRRVKAITRALSTSLFLFLLRACALKYAASHSPTLSLSSYNMY